MVNEVFQLDQWNCRVDDEPVHEPCTNPARTLHDPCSKEDPVVEFNDYSAALLVRHKLTSAYGEAERRRALGRRDQPRRHRARYAVGRLLLRLGRQLGDGIASPGLWASDPNPAGGPAGSTR